MYANINPIVHERIYKAKMILKIFFRTLFLVLIYPIKATINIGKLIYQYLIKEINNIVKVKNKPLRESFISYILSLFTNVQKHC